MAQTVDLNHPWTKAYRLPVVTEPAYAGYFVELRVPRGSEYDNTVVPTEEEAALLGSYLAYKIDRYGFYDSYRKKMLEEPLDTDGIVNTVDFTKYHDGVWRYHLLTWRHGPWPFWGAEKQYSSLLELLDKIERFCDEPNEKWVAWKLEHKLT